MEPLRRRKSDERNSYCRVNSRYTPVSSLPGTTYSGAQEKCFNDAMAAKKSGYEEGRAEVEQLRTKVVGFECGHGVALMEHCTYCDEAADAKEPTDG